MYIENQEKLTNILKKPSRDPEPPEPCFIHLKEDEEPYLVTEFPESWENIADKTTKNEGLQIEEIFFSPVKRKRTKRKISTKSKIDLNSEKNSDPKGRAPSLTKKFCCDKCDYKVLKNIWLLNHKWKVNNGPIPPKKYFVCEICSKQFNKSEYLNRHLDRHYDIKRFICGNS